MTVQRHVPMHALEGKRAEMMNLAALGGIVLTIFAALYALCWAFYRAGGASSRTRIDELSALAKLWQGRAERAMAGKHRKPEPLQVRAKTAVPPWTPTLTVARLPQPTTNPTPNTITMGAVTTGGMRALTDDYIAKLEMDGIAYRKGLTAS